MFFCRAAQIVAAILFVLSLFQVAVGFLIVFSAPEHMEALLQRYGTAKTTGQMIDRGTYGVLIAVALGALSEIGIALKTLANNSRT